MTKLADETLMFYVDGALDADERLRVEAALASDPAARARLQVFRATGRVLTELMHHYGEPPAPKRLIDSVLPSDNEPAATGDESRNASATKPLHWRGALSTVASIPLIAALASVAALIVGIGLGWSARGDHGNAVQTMALAELVQVDNMRVVARSPLHTALETVRSGTEAKLADVANGASHIKMWMTFRNEARDYCRQYEIVDASASRYGGVACRDDGGHWSILLQALVAPRSPSQEQTVPAANSNAAMDAVVLALMDGDALATDDEATAIKKRWKK